MLGRYEFVPTVPVHPKSATLLAACTIVGCLSSFVPSAVAQATGACCDNLCSEGFTEAGCLASGGFYFGNGSKCTLGGLDECGACCNQNTGLCQNVTSDSFDCVGPQETFYHNQQCSEITCELPAGTTGACCDNLCSEGFTQAGCLATGGFYFGNGSKCTLGGLDECGACCNQNTGLCENVTSDSFDCVGPQETFSHNQQCSEITCALPGPECGNNVREGAEECDGSDATACPGQCLADCSCSRPPGQVCGNNLREGTEQCDGTDDAACRILCQSDCTCSAPIPTVSEWGMLILALSLLTGAKLRFGRRTTPG